MSITVLTEDEVRAIAREEARRPVFVTQLTVEAVIGLPRRDYLRAARNCVFASTTQQRKIIARTKDVIDAIERRLVIRPHAKPANDADAETVTLARAGARRVAG